MDLQDINIQDIGNQMMNSVQGESTTVIVMTIICALLTVFFGYKLMKVWISLSGFFIGFILGAVIAGVFKASVPVLLIVALVAAILFAIVAFFFYKLGIFVFIGMASFIAVTNFINTIYSGNQTWLVAVIGIIIGILVGILAVKFVRPVFILTSAISGAITLATTICPLLHLTSWVVMLITAAVIAVLGILWQFSSTGKGTYEEAE